MQNIVFSNKDAGTFVAVADYARANNKGGARAVKSNIGAAGCALVVKASVITVPWAGSGVAPQVYAAAGI